MKEISRSKTTKGPEKMFTGDVFFDVIVRGDEPSRVRINSVHFTPGARTAWHSHAVGQSLHVTEGAGFIQERGGSVKVLRVGDTVYTEPGVWHWHGAAAENFMTHLAIWEGDDSEWGDQVTDAEYIHANEAL